MLLPDSLAVPRASGYELLAWLEETSQAIAENVDARINVQKALLEVEEMNLHNRAELSHARACLQGTDLNPAQRAALEDEVGARPLMA